MSDFECESCEREKKRRKKARHLGWEFQISYYTVHVPVPVCRMMLEHGTKKQRA